MIKEDIFIELNFSEDQLEAIRQIYYKYFHPRMPEVFDGRGVIAMWREDYSWIPGHGLDKNHNHLGITSIECRTDPLWENFSDILHFMGKSAVITKMQPSMVMRPHVDRKWRPNAIYFPISGCSDECVTEYYNLPKQNTENSQSIPFFPAPLFSYAVSKKAILTNVHEWHGVKNNSNLERISFGWNFNSAELSFSDCKELIKKYA